MISDNLILFVFNGTGLIISLAAIAVSVNVFGKVEGRLRVRYRALIKGFAVVGLSFLWTFLFGSMITPSKITSIQSVILSFGMAILIYSANKLFNIYQEGVDRNSNKK